MAWPSVWPDLGAISEGQRELLQLLAQGKANKEIAHELGRSINTVKTQIARLCARMRVTGRVALVVAALKLGWIALDEIELTYVD
jgi:DNA-binding NarL/FixJ family response regulator